MSVDVGSLQRAIFNSANFSSIATDAKGIIQIFNVGAETMLGYSAEEVTNKITPAEICDPQEIVARANTLSAEMGTPIAPGFDALSFKASRGIEDIYELTYVRKDGSRFPAVVSVTALRDAASEIIGYLLIGTDNTTRKSLQEERVVLDQRLRDQHFYTRSLIESNIDALITTDPAGIITDVNGQVETLTDCTRDELIGSPFKKHFVDSERAEACINLVLSSATVTNYELTARTREGKAIPVSCNASTFCDRERKLLGVFVAARDVTEAKGLELLLQRQNAKLEAASRIKSEFLANMSHELRTPLNAIIGFSEVLRDGLLGEMTERQRNFIGDIFGSGQHLLALINDILDLSKVEAGKMTLDLEAVNISSLVANSLSIVRQRAVARKIRLVANDVESPESILADGRKVKQIVYNLLSNAVKFTGDGGTVTMHAKRVARADVGRLAAPWPGRSLCHDELIAADVDQFLALSVSDTGAGIPAEALASLFEPFSQVDSGLARKFRDTGLGLVMVKLLSELHGGTVAVSSALGEGSCFTVWLPFRKPERRTRLAEAPPVVVDPPREPRVAMIVEDDLKAAEILRVQLVACGFEVLRAASAETALALALARPLSLITLDILLPEMDGWELLRRLKRIPSLTHVPVVIMSIAPEGNRGFAVGAAAVMQKPVSRQELYETLVGLGLFPLPSGKTLRVLLADDDPAAIDLLAVHVEGMGAEVIRAYGGDEAIATARSKRPDLIVLDLMMPEVNGFDVVAALNEQVETSTIPVLVVTARDVTAKEHAKLSGYVTAILKKTEFDSDRFMVEVRRALAGRNAET